MLYEKAVSKKQQRFFGVVRAAQKGTLEGEASPQVQRAAANMTKSDVKKMASTKHKGLPEKAATKESFATDKYKEMAKREADLKRKEDLKVKTKKESVDIDEAKYEKGASNYGKASIRNKRMFGKGGNAAPPEERGAAITVRRSRHQERRYVKKGNKYHEPGKHRPEVYGVNKPEEERKNKNVKEGTKYGLYKGDGKVKFKLYKPEKKKEKDGLMKKESIFTPLVFTVHEAKIDDKKYGKGKGWDQPEGKSMTSYKARHSYLKKNPDNVRSDRNKRHSAQDVVFHGHDKVERDRKKKHFASKGVKKVKGAKTPSGGKEALKKRFQDQGAMEAYVNERLGGKGYKPYTSLTGKKVSGDWEDSDRGEGNKATRRAGGKVKAKSPTYIAHVKNKQKVKEEVTSVYEGLLSKFGKKKEKKVEKKPQKAMDAGARGRRLLQRREYKAKVSEFIPKELEDQYTPNGELVLEYPGENIVKSLIKKAQNNAAARKKWRDENPGGTISKQTHINRIKNQGGDTSHWEEKSLTVDEAKVDAGKSPEEKEKVRNKRKFGVTHNVVGHAKLRRSLHKMNRGDKKIKGDKSAWTEMET
jgi:hypothetical protein